MGIESFLEKFLNRFRWISKNSKNRYFSSKIEQDFSQNMKLKIETMKKWKKIKKILKSRDRSGWSSEDC